MARRSRRAWSCVALAVLVAAGCSRPPDDYGRQAEEVFLRSCVQSGGTDLENVCRCAYNRIKAEIPYETYVELDKAVQDNPDAMPEQIVAVIVDCAADQAATTSTTDATESTTSTTGP